jgi:hypothetical protein
MFNLALVNPVFLGSTGTSIGLERVFVLVFSRNFMPLGDLIGMASHELSIIERAFQTIHKSIQHRGTLS